MFVPLQAVPGSIDEGHLFTRWIGRLWELNIHMTACQCDFISMERIDEKHLPFFGPRVCFLL
jgi:hypothetical protein